MPVLRDLAGNFAITIEDKKKIERKDMYLPPPQNDGVYPVCCERQTFEKVTREIVQKAFSNQRKKPLVLIDLISELYIFYRYETLSAQ